MLSRFKRLPSPALVISVIALSVAIGGVAVALPGHNSVKSDDIKNGQVKSPDLRNNGVKGKDVLESSLGTVPNANHANSADNANNLGGDPASSYAPATTLRTALVRANGTVAAAHSDGVSDANVTQPVAGLYCFDGLSPAPRSVVATVAGGQATVQTQVQYDPAGGQCAGKQFDVATINDSNGLVAEDFTVFIH